MEIAFYKEKGGETMSLYSEREQAKQFEREMQVLLKEEVALSREVLSNLSQQERLLLIGDTTLSKDLRKDYFLLTKQKMRFLKEKARLNENKHWQCMNTIQIQLLNDELFALNEKIEKQLSLNEHLITLIENTGCVSKVKKSSTVKRKNRLITLDYPSQKE